MALDELILFRSGDALFVQDLYARQRAKLIACARQYSHDSEDVDDAVAETWNVAWEKRDTFRGDGPLEHWLLKICMSVCLNRLRRRKREAKLLQWSFETDDQVDVDVRVAEAAAIALQAVANTVAEAVQALPPRQRRTVELRHFGNKTTAEAAATMHCAPGTVKAHLHKAMKQLAPKTEAAVVALADARAALASGSPEGYL
jgi:RNA polymerase sigma-70 factor, ECF subfamily